MFHSSPHLRLGRPFEQLALQFLLAGQVELILAGVDVGVLGERDFHQGFVLLFAEDDADGRVLVGGLRSGGRTC